MVDQKISKTKEGNKGGRQKQKEHEIYKNQIATWQT